MNRHLKKISSIYLYDKKNTLKIINKLEIIKDKNFVVFYNPECIGIMNSTIEMFKSENAVSLNELFNKKQINNIAETIVKFGFKQVIFSTMAFGYKDLAEKIYGLNNKIKIKFLWHGSHSLFVNYNEQKFLESILELQKRKVVSSIGFLKKSMANYYSKKGYNTMFVMNNVNLDVIPEKISIDKINDNKSTRIGVYSSGDRWEKNTYNQLSACAMMKNVIVDILPKTKLAVSFCKLMNLQINDEKLNYKVSRSELIKLMANNDLNLYVTFTECAPMIPLESLEVGVPCLMGNNTSYFENSKLNDYLVVKEEDSIDEIYSKMKVCLENKKEIITLYREWKKQYDIDSKQSVKEFLEI